MIALFLAVGFELFDTAHAYLHLGGGVAAVLGAAVVMSLWGSSGARVGWALLVVGLLLLSGGQFLQSVGAFASVNPPESNRLLGTPLLDRSLHSSAGALLFVSLVIIALGGVLLGVSRARRHPA